MKKLLLSIGFLGAIAGAYMLGVYAGLGQMWAHSHSITADSAYYAIEVPPIFKVESIESCEEYWVGEKKGDLSNSVREYGRYLGHWSSNLPTFTPHNDSTVKFFKNSVTYYHEEILGKTNQKTPLEIVSEAKSEMIAEGKYTEEEMEHGFETWLLDLQRDEENYKKVLDSVGYGAK